MHDSDIEDLMVVAAGRLLDAVTTSAPPIGELAHVGSRAVDRVDRGPRGRGEASPSSRQRPADRGDCFRQGLRTGRGSVSSPPCPTAEERPSARQGSRCKQPHRSSKDMLRDAWRKYETRADPLRRPRPRGAFLGDRGRALRSFGALQ